MLWQHTSRKQNYAPLSSSFLICRARRPELFSVSACRYRNSASLPWPAAATHAAVSVSEPNYSSITRKPYPQAPPFFAGTGYAGRVGDIRVCERGATPPVVWTLAGRFVTFCCVFARPWSSTAHPQKQLTWVDNDRNRHRRGKSSAGIVCGRYIIWGFFSGAPCGVSHPEPAPYLILSYLNNLITWIHNFKT